LREKTHEGINWYMRPRDNATPQGAQLSEGDRGTHWLVPDTPARGAGVQGSMSAASERRNGQGCQPRKPPQCRPSHLHSSVSLPSLLAEQLAQDALRARGVFLGLGEHLWEGSEKVPRMVVSVILRAVLTGAGSTRGKAPGKFRLGSEVVPRESSETVPRWSKRARVRGAAPWSRLRRRAAERRRTSPTPS